MVRGDKHCVQPRKEQAGKEKHQKWNCRIRMTQNTVISSRGIHSPSLYQLNNSPPTPIKSRLIFRWASPRPRNTISSTRDDSSSSFVLPAEKPPQPPNKKPHWTCSRMFSQSCETRNRSRTRPAAHWLPPLLANRGRRKQWCPGKVLGHPTWAAQLWPRKLPCFLTAHPHKQLPCLQHYITQPLLDKPKHIKLHVQEQVKFICNHYQMTPTWNFN